MKATITDVTCIFILTLCLYVGVYYFLPTAPTATVMVVLAGLSAITFFLAKFWWRKFRMKKKTPGALPLVVLVLALSSIARARNPYDTPKQPIEQSLSSPLCRISSGPMAGATILTAESGFIGQRCVDRSGNAGVVMAKGNLRSSASSQCYIELGKRAGTIIDVSRPSLIGSPCRGTGDNTGISVSPRWSVAPISDQTGHSQGGQATSSKDPEVHRATGTMPLSRKSKEELGYGLYSYGLLAHAPEEKDLPRYRSFLRALLDLPLPSDIAISLAKFKINATYIPLTSIPASWDEMPVESQVEYALYHYDYARSAAVLATVPNPTGDGPVLLSALTPWGGREISYPFLVQDLSKAQPEMVGAYVKNFTDQVAKPQFWVPNRLESFAVQLENLLVITASGVGVSRDAVLVWLRISR